MATQINYIIAMIVILQHLPHKFHLWNVNTKQSDDVFPFYFFCSSDPVRNGHTKWVAAWYIVTAKHILLGCWNHEAINLLRTKSGFLLASILDC